VILHYGKKSILKFDNFWLSEFHNGSGTKNRFQQLWMYKILKHRKLPRIPCLGETHIQLQWYNIFPLLFSFLCFYNAIFSTPVTSWNLRNQAPLFTLIIMSYYVNKDTPVFSAFLDSAKAFDRTNHNLLFAKLIKCNVPMCIVRLLLSWYRQQTMQVKWGTNYSSPFTVTNGVRQEESWVHIYLLFTWMNSQSSWDQPGWDALWEMWLWIIWCLLTMYVCSAPVLVGCNDFWISVVTMLLNTKSLLIVTKQLVFFLAQKSINNLPQQMFF